MSPPPPLDDCPTLTPPLPPLSKWVDKWRIPSSKGGDVRTPGLFSDVLRVCTSKHSVKSLVSLCSRKVVSQVWGPQPMVQLGIAHVPPLLPHKM